jgi:hypothetical protein
MAVFWVVAPCSLAEVYQRFRDNDLCVISDDLKFQKDIKLPPDFP